MKRSMSLVMGVGLVRTPMLLDLFFKVGSRRRTYWPRGFSHEPTNPSR